MDFQKFTIKTQEAVQQAQNIAEAKGHQSIETGHLLQGILEVDQEVIPYILKKLNINQGMLQAALGRIVEAYPKVSGGQVYLSPAANRVFQSAIGTLKEFGDEYVSIEILFYSLLLQMAHQVNYNLTSEIIWLAKKYHLIMHLH